MIRCPVLRVLEKRFCNPRLASPIARHYKVKHIDLAVNPELSLQRFIPNSVEQWDSIRNGTLKPNAIPYNYDGYVWWKCPKGEDHVWKSKCRKRVDKENRRLQRMYHRIL